MLEFLTELALAIPPELARAISLDLECALDGGVPPRPCSLVLYYLGCPTTIQKERTYPEQTFGLNVSVMW